MWYGVASNLLWFDLGLISQPSAGWYYQLFAFTCTCTIYLVARCIVFVENGAMQRDLGQLDEGDAL